MYNKNWSRDTLNRQKVGTFGEYYAKMALASYGMDIYTSEVDDHGIDFVAESPDKKSFRKFQVKAIREGTTYVFMRKKYFDIKDESLYLVLIYLVDGMDPEVYIIPADAWNRGIDALVHRIYTTGEEYGINFSKKNRISLAQFKIDKMIDSIM
ncbi:MAG: DUF4365 domain-containing protein [Eubacteriales bacterium]|nr:DUF4365 domain-containing protein [Eubacteriales bacterium]